MRFETDFSVPGEPHEVIRLFADLPRMAPLMPGASVEPQQEDGTYPGSLTVAVGPKKLVFKGRVRNEVDLASCSGVLSGRAATDMRAAKLAVTVNYALTPEEGPAGQATRVRLVSEAELFGILAEFAGTIGKTVANAMLDEFGRRFAESYSDPEALPAYSDSPALGAGQLTRMVARSAWGSLKDKISGSKKD